MNIPDPTPPRVSICIPTRNRKDALIVCLESCLAQDYRPLEIIVYDDASTDGTSGEVKRLFPEILCISTKERVGQAGLRDRGFRDCHGDFVFSLDDDAYFSDT
ncbi:MAG: glycosyltransferase, partial [Verrucomicrobia bacterium]|nr:glycosyltransferase [Verrucomicrobiota bacterium]